MKYRTDVVRKTEIELMKEIGQTSAIIKECFYSDKDEVVRAKKALRRMEKALKELDTYYPEEDAQ